MNAEWLLEHFDRISEAPDAVARLRKFILDLAVRGKLVEQDPSDEPGSELFKQIAEQKSALGLRHQVSPLQPEEIPFTLPHGWAWGRIGEVCSKTGSGSTPRGGRDVYKGRGIPFLRSQNVYDDGLKLDDVAYIDAATHLRMSGTAVKPGDLLLNITGGSIGRCCRVPDEFGEANVSQHVAIVRPAVTAMTGFLHLVIRSPYFQKFIFDEQTGAGRGGLPKNRMDRIAVAIPPLAEQHRIVAKVDELMAVCDQLEASRKEREVRRDQLVMASLARLNTPDPEPATFAEHARFALETLPALTTRPDQIKQLRQTILNLAVCGRLVPQDPNDEPASELLKRIAAEKALIGEGRRLGNTKTTSKLLGKDVSFAAPVGWIWAAFGDLVISRDGERMPVSKDERSRRAKVYDYYGASGVIDKIDGYLFDKPLLLIGEDGANLINRSTPIAFIARGKYWVNNHAHVLDGLSEEFLRYLEVFINASDLKPFVTGTAQPKMNQAKMSSIPVALPPLAEQHRIVAKVDALMTLCDHLEASLSASTNARRRLLQATLREALEPAMEEAA